MCLNRCFSAFECIEILFCFAFNVALTSEGMAGGGETTASLTFDVANK